MRRDKKLPGIFAITLTFNASVPPIVVSVPTCFGDECANGRRFVGAMRGGNSIAERDERSVGSADVGRKREVERRTRRSFDVRNHRR